jgi:hypothetical protein
MKRFPAIILFLPALAFAAPPAEVLNTDVRQETIAETICTPGYTKSVRPATSYTNGVKLKLMREQGIDSGRAREFELDHREPLELGGHPRNIHNLQLQPWDGADGAHAKDRLEHRLHRMVCKGKISLTEAQACIWDDWQACAASHPGRRR